MKVAARYFTPSCLKIFHKSLGPLFHSPLQVVYRVPDLKSVGCGFKPVLIAN